MARNHFNGSFRSGGFLRRRRGRAAEPAEITFDLAVIAVRHITVAFRFARVTAKPGSRGAARRAAKP